MRLIGESLDGTGPERDTYLDSWFAAESKPAIKIAALEYLGEWGTSNDLPTVKAELERADFQTRNAALEAVLRIALRQSREAAVRALLELQPDTVAENLVGELFADGGAGIPQSLLIEGLAHPSDAVRAACARMLGEAHALDMDKAEHLLKDSSSAVREAAAQALVNDGRSFSDQELKTLFQQRRAFGGLFSLGMPPQVEEKRVATLKRAQLEKLPERELKQLVQDMNILDHEPYLVLASKRFRRHAERLRAMLDDLFVGEFQRALEDLGRRFGDASEVVTKMRSLENNLRTDHLQKVLEVVTTFGDVSDLRRVRHVIRSGLIRVTAREIDYLRRFGEWEDIDLIISAVDQVPVSTLSLLIEEDSLSLPAVDALLQLSQGRFAELLGKSMRQRQGVTGATIKRDLTALSSVLGFAESRGSCGGNPALEAQRSRWLVRERRDPIILPHAGDIERVIQRAPGLWKAMIRFAMIEGARQEEIRSLQHRMIDREAGQITLVGKRNRMRVIEIASRTRDLLSEIPTSKDTPLVFWTASASIPARGYKNVSSRFAQLVKEVASQCAERRIQFTRFRFHDLRHYAAVSFLRSGRGTIYDLQLHLGHESVKTTEIYLRYLTPKEVLRAKFGPPAWDCGHPRNSPACS
jgi:integrase